MAVTVTHARLVKPLLAPRAARRAVTDPKFSKGTDGYNKACLYDTWLCYLRTRRQARSQVTNH